MGEVEKSKGLHGLFDQHVHGGGGCSFATDRVEDILKAYQAHREHGTHFLLAAYATLPYERLRRYLSALREAMSEEPGIVGAYLEGPFINPEKAGGMRRDYIEGWIFEELKSLVEEFADVLKLMVVAPERDDDYRVLELLRANGVKVSIGHTVASYEQTCRYIERGAEMVTHLYNAMGPFHHRAPGAVAAALVMDVYCEIIPQFSHIHPAALKMAYRLKEDKLVFVSDAMPLAASDLSSMKMGRIWVYKKDGACYNEEGRLFGSAITLREGIASASKALGVDQDLLVDVNIRFFKEFWGDR